MNRDLVEGRGIILREVLMRGDESAVRHASESRHASTFERGETLNLPVSLDVMHDHIVFPWPVLARRRHPG